MLLVIMVESLFVVFWLLLKVELLVLSLIILGSIISFIMEFEIEELMELILSIWDSVGAIVDLLLLESVEEMLFVRLFVLLNWLESIVCSSIVLFINLVILFSIVLSKRFEELLKLDFKDELVVTLKDNISEMLAILLVSTDLFFILLKNPDLVLLKFL